MKREDFDLDRWRTHFTGVWVPTNKFWNKALEVVEEDLLDFIFTDRNGEVPYEELAGALGGARYAFVRMSRAYQDYKFDEIVKDLK